MRKIYLLFTFLISLSIYAQESYYEGIDFTLPPDQLFRVLQNKLEDYNTSYTYGEVRDMMKIADEWEEDHSKVVLIYGYDDNDNNCTTDYTRDKNKFGGSNCEYNREHVFPRSLAVPGMGATNNNRTGIVADPHNLRPADQKMNQDRENFKFGPGSGNAGTRNSTTGTHWYPGDEWKGDVARMMMYMYVRYGEQCLPSLVGKGDTMDQNEMLELFLEWNAEDPVNYLEIQRNDYLEGVYGNRNPFIDNPHLATTLWGGMPAEDRWEILNVPLYEWEENFSIYPNPASDVIWVESTTTNEHTVYTLYNITGKKVWEDSAAASSSKKSIPVQDLASGIYILNIHDTQHSLNKKVIVK